MHIAMFCSNYPPHPGGLEVMVENLARGLASRHQVTLVAAGWADAMGVREEHGMTVHRLPTVHASEAWGVPYPVPKGAGVRARCGAVRRRLPLTRRAVRL